MKCAELKQASASPSRITFHTRTWNMLWSSPAFQYILWGRNHKQLLYFKIRKFNQRRVIGTGDPSVSIFAIHCKHVSACCFMCGWSRSGHLSLKEMDAVGEDSGTWSRQRLSWEHGNWLWYCRRGELSFEERSGRMVSGVWRENTHSKDSKVMRWYYGQNHWGIRSEKTKCHNFTLKETRAHGMLRSSFRWIGVSLPSINYQYLICVCTNHGRSTPVHSLITFAPCIQLNILILIVLIWIRS